MGIPKPSRGATSKISSAALPATSSATQSAPQASILKSAFTPSHFQLGLFASVIQGFDSQHVRIHDTNSGRLRCEHGVGARTIINSLDWGYYGKSFRNKDTQTGKKKRKRGAANNSPQYSPESAVVALGTSKSEIEIFSISEEKVVSILVGPHDRGIRDFRFCPSDYLQGWSIGGDSKLVQWDLRIDQATRTISLPDSKINVLAEPTTIEPQILCASSTPYAITLTGLNDFRIDDFDAFKSPIHTLICSGLDAKSSHTQRAFIASDRNRYLNIYDIDQHRLLRTLIAGSEVNSVHFQGNPSDASATCKQSVLAVTTRNGVVELFARPFAEAVTQTDVVVDLTSKRKSLTRKSNASIRITRPDAKGTTIPVFQASFQGPNICVSWADGGVDVAFQKIRWQDEGTGELLFDGIKEVVRSQKSSFNSATMNGVKDVGNYHVDESRAVVVDGGGQGSSQDAAIEISSADGDESEGSQEAEENAASQGEDGSTDGDEATAASKEELDAPIHASDSEMAEANGSPFEHGDSVNPDASEVPMEPTFGEILAAQNPDTISIAAALAPDNNDTSLATTTNPLVLSSGVSLSTVLTQSLRTNDQNLLETCLHTVDTSTIRLTIQRLDPSLAGVLLQKLAERLSSKPGRYGHLLLWVQWICVAHGGAIAGRPDVLSKLKTMSKVLNQRSKTLENLLLLKGKLDMLDAQISLRRQLQAERGAARDANDKRDVIYIEGQEENYSSDDDKTAGDTPAGIKVGTTKKGLPNLVDVDESSDDGEDVPLVNGFDGSSDAAESEEEEEEDGEKANEAADAQTAGDLLDDEAEESDKDEESDVGEESDADEDEESDEDDSEMDDFIHDDSVSEAESTSELVEAIITPEKPPTKKIKT